MNMTEMKDECRFHKLTQEQVETLDQVLTEIIPIHGRGNFPTLEIKPKDIIHVVRDRLILKNIKVKDVRLNGSTASHVLVKENGTSYKDLDIIFGVELPKQEDFQIIKEVVLGCLLDFLPKGVNKDKITALTMKEAYVQKMVKVFTEHDKWSLISLSNNSGKNVELKFVNSLRRQFEFSVDSFQIILDSMLQSYLEAEMRKLVEQKEKEQDFSLSKRCGFQTAPANDSSLNSGNMGHDQESDTDILCETDDMQSSCNCDSYSKLNVTQKEQSQFSEKKETPKTVNKVVKTDMTETTTRPESMEQGSKQSFMVHVEDKNKFENIFTNKTGIDSGNKKELIVVKNESSVKDTTSPTETYVSATDFTQTEYMLEIGSVDAQPWLELVHTDCSCLSAAGTIGYQCTFQPAPITFLSQTAFESYAEYSLPPPAKKNSQSSQMVVLKHSSPKPPRKMSKKTTPLPCSLEKSVSDHSSADKVLHPAKTYPGESLTVQVKSQNLTTKNFDLPSAVEKGPESKEKQLAILTGEFTSDTLESIVHSEEILAISVSPDKSQVQRSEPETGEATYVPIISMMSDSNNLAKDHNWIKQSITERAQTAQCKTMAPLIRLNSQPLLQANDSNHINLLSTRKKETTETTYAQAEEPMSPKHSSRPSEPVTKITNCPFQIMKPLSTNLTTNSQFVETKSLYSEHMPSPEVHKYSASSLQTQEPLVRCPQTNELPKLISHVLEPPVSLSIAQSLTVSSPHFTKSFDPSIPSSEEIVSLKLSKIPEPFLEPAICLDVIDSSEVSREVLQQILEPTAVSPHPLKISASQEMVSKSLDRSPSDTKRPLFSSKEIPHITVMAESMYGDFEQAMDHLRYRLIATRNPEEIRGGGLLKYSNLLVRDFKPASETEIKTLERYMCSRFFIDFPDVNEQQRKIESYLRNHFIGEEKSKYDYLMTLRRVVNESTVCLMGHERRQTLNMITILALKVLGEQNIIPNANNVTCYYQPAPYMADHNFSNYYIANSHSPLIYHPYPLHIHMQTGLV